MKSFKKISSLIFISVLLFSCNSEQAIDKKILGKWMMEKVYDGETDVSDQHNPENNRFIKFNRNGSFESGGDPYGYNDGDWEIDMEKSTLFIDSKEDNNDSEWKIHFEGDQMIWTGIGTPRQEEFSIVHQKVN